MFFGPASHGRLVPLDRPSTMRTIDPESEWELY